MDLDIYNTTKNWCFTELDQEAEEKFSQIEQATRAQAPENFYHSNFCPSQNRPSSTLIS